MAMAKTWTKRSSSGKTTGWKKRKATGRVTKKSSSKVGATKLRAVVAQEVRNELRSGDQNDRKKVTMTLLLPDAGVYLNGKEAQNSCIRIPVTGAIPSQAGAGQGPDERRRGSNKIKVTGVNLRASFSTLVLHLICNRVPSRGVSHAIWPK